MFQTDCKKTNNNEIKDVQRLLQRYLGQERSVVKVEIKKLTSAGENYGSLMLAVEIHIRNNKTNQNEVLHSVAKMCPPNEWLQKFFGTSTTFKTEMEFYNTIVPTMKEFQIQQGVSNVVDCFPECYGARVSLKGNRVDDDAVILLENLKMSGYEVIDRMKGFDLDVTKLLLEDLAKLHAIPIAIKLLKPDVFHAKILPHLDRNLVFSQLSESVEEETIESAVKLCEAKEECLPFISDIRKSLRRCLDNFKSEPDLREPFATINHNDYWINNTMVKFQNGKIVKNKMVDFQMMDYGSPANDVVFLLFSSVQKDVLDKHYDHLIKLYYDKFINTLKELKCDTTLFTFERLLEEIDICAKSRQFFHILLMLKTILAIEGKVRELVELTEEDIISEVHTSDVYRKRLPEVTYEFIKRKWIYV